MNFKNAKFKLPNPVVANFLRITAIFMLLFTGLRLLLLLFDYSLFAGVPFPVLAQSFAVGLRFDLAVTLYFIAPLFLINYIFYFFNRPAKLITFNTVYLTFFFLVCSFLGAAEIEFYKYFQIRLNAFFVNWEENPAFIIKMVWESYPVLLYLLPVFGLTVLTGWLFRRMQRKFYGSGTVRQDLRLKTVFFLFSALLIFFGIRGTFSFKTPLRWGHAYFSRYNAANQLALNGLFTLANDILYQENRGEHPAKLLGIRNRDKAYRTVRRLVRDSTGTMVNFPLRRYRFTGKPRKKNVVIILLESFSSFAVRQATERGDSLYFNDLKEHSLCLPNFYSNGFHTYMGLFSSLFGMPNVYGKSILKRNEGQQEFSGIHNILSRKGYHSYFAVSHDPNFDNMAGFLRGNGVEKIISQFDFPQTEVLSTLGVADHKLLEKMNDVFRRAEQPFVATILTTNNHGPWIIPEVPGRTFQSTFEYTDWALHHFLQLAQKEDYFRNTLFVITGDHGKAETPGYDLNLQAFHIPCVFYSPGFVRPQEIRNIAGQTDLTQMIMDFLQMDYHTTNLGRNVLNFPNDSTGFAMFQEGTKIGFIRDQWYLIDRLSGEPSLYRYRSKEPRHDYAGEKPELLGELQRDARSLFFVANDMILKRKVSAGHWK